MADSNDKTQLVSHTRDRFMSVSSFTNNDSTQNKLQNNDEEGDDEVAYVFHDVIDGTSSALAHRRIDDIRATERTSSNASSSRYSFYDVAEKDDTDEDAANDVKDNDKDNAIFYDVKERASSSVMFSPILPNNDSNHNYIDGQYKPLSNNESANGGPSTVVANGEPSLHNASTSLLRSQHQIYEYGSCNNPNTNNNNNVGFINTQQGQKAPTQGIVANSALHSANSGNASTSSNLCRATFPKQHKLQHNGTHDHTDNPILKSSTSCGKCVQESTDDQNKAPVSSSYSANTAQFLSTLILLLYGIALVPAISLTSQYLTVRWRQESGLNLSDEVNRSVCAGGKDGNLTVDDKISARVSDVVTYYNYVISGCSIVVCLFLGSYADIIGRRIIIITPTFFTVLHFIIVICIMRFDLDTNYFYASSAVFGTGGSFYAMLIGVFTVTSDVNNGKDNRVIWLALQLCITSVTLALGNIGLGYVIKYIGFYQAAIILEIFAIIAFLVALFFMPETLPEEVKAKSQKSSMTKNPLKIMCGVFRMYTSEGSVRNRKCLWIGIVLFFFAVIPDLQLLTIDTIFQLHKPLCWVSTEIGYYGAIQTGGKKLAGTILLKFLQGRGWIKVEKLAMLVCLFQAGSMVLEALLKHSWQMYLVPVIGTPSIITVPVIRGIMSFLAGKDNLGALFTSIALMEILCSILAATCINKVYVATVDYMPGAVYFLMAAFAVVTFLLFIPFFYIYEDPTLKPTDEKDKPQA